MGDVTERRLSKLSRGIGTLSGTVQRETPVYIHESSDEYGILQDASEKAFEEFILFQVKGQHATVHNSKEKREGKTLTTENVVHRTYSTKLGTLILYSDSLYLKEKKRKKLVKKEIKSSIEDVTFEGTVEDLTAYILRFGNDNFKFVSNASGLRDERLVSVRPGYSPIRYIASASKLWKPDQVEKLVEEKALKEDHIRRYQKIKLPKVDIVPSSEYDPLLRSRPKPYSHISLPELLLRKGRVPSGVSKVHETEGKVEDASSGYAKSLLSERKPFERKTITRKKTMQMKRLELHLPNEEPKRKSSKVEEPLKEDVYDDETNDSLSDWGKLVETTRNVIDRTFENVLREKAKEEYGQLKGNQQMSDENKFGERLNLERRLSSSTDSDEIALRGADYASLDQKEKEQVISHLLLKGIANEASTIESLMTADNDDKGSVYSENKIDLSEQISFPAMPNLPAVIGLDKTKGFKGNALHGSLPSANSNKSNQRAKTGSLKDGLVISSISKLPPIKSESVTPKVSQGNRDDLDRKGLKLPPIPRKGIAISASAKKATIDTEMNRDNLFIGGHAIEVAEVHIHLEEENMKQNAELSEDGYDDSSDSVDNGDSSLMDILRKKETGSQESLRRYEEVGFKSPSPSYLIEKDNSRYQTPDSGLSTATGLTLASDVNPVQNDHKVPIEPMTPVVEESSRSSKASKMLSREGTLNLTSSSIKRGAESVVSGSPKKREETQISMDLKIKEGTLIEEKGEETLSPLQGRSISEDRTGISIEVTIGQMSRQDEPDGMLSEKERSFNGILEGSNVDAENASSANVVPDAIDPTATAVEDEGVFMEEETHPVVEEDVTDTSKIELECEDSKVSKLSDSVSVSVELEGNFDDAKADPGSIASRRSSGLLLAQAQAAAKSALSRPKSGFDIIEDMKVAADAFGKLFGEQMQRETSKPGSIHRGRTQSDATQLAHGKRTLDKNRAASSLSTSAAKRIAPVDVNSLKATITSYESLHDTKNSNSDLNKAPSKPAKDLEKESAADLGGVAVASDKSFPAASSKSVPSRKSSPAKDMQMDIISYASVEADPKEVEVLVQKEGSMLEQEAEIAREKTVDTEEERFAKALNEIVEEVNDLKEKKPVKKKKVRKSGRPTEEQNHIMRDMASVSPPFLTGRAKGGKPPIGLSNKEQDVSKPKGRKGKGKKDSKKVKVSKNKKPNKKVAVVEKDTDIIAKDEEQELEELESEMKEEVQEDVKKEELQVEEAPEHDPNDKYDVPLTIKPAANIPDPESEKEIQDASAEEVTVGEKESDDAKKNALGLHSDSPENYAKGASFVSSVGFETDEYGVVSSNDEGSDHRRRMDDRMKKRKLEAERRRLKVEQRRREKEDAKRKQQEQAEREERMRQEAELEMQRRIEEVKNRRKMEEEEKRMQEEAEKRRQRLLEREREREKREKEDLKRKMAAMAAKLRLEEERRSEQERIARELEEERRRQEEELLKAMEEHERIEYERKKKEDEEERLRQEAEKQRIEREKRLIEEEEHRIKMQKLQEFHQMLLERAKFWEGMKNSKWFLEINQRLTQAFTFSYFDLLPAMLFEFTNLRPFSPKENGFGLPTIYEETKGEDV